MSEGTARNLRIRAARPADGARAVAIWRAAVDATHHFLATEDRASLDILVGEMLPAAPLWLAVDETDGALGFMLLDGGAIEALFVDPAVHGRGIGRGLVEHAAAMAGALTVDVNEQNGSALGFYRRLGFEPVGRSEVDRQGRPYPLLHLRRDAP